jgi:hypothetical protein
MGLRQLLTFGCGFELGPERRVLAPQDRDLAPGVGQVAGKVRERGPEPLCPLRRSERLPGAPDQRISMAV